MEYLSEFSPEPSLLQTKQSQLPQLAFVGKVLQHSDNPCGPPPDLLRKPHIFTELEAPDMHAVLQMDSHKGRAEEGNHLLLPAAIPMLM